MQTLSRKAIAYISVVTITGLAVLVAGLRDFHSQNPSQYLCYIAMALITTGLKVNLPALTGTLSVNFLFILMGIMELSLAETLAMGALATAVQCFWHARGRFRGVQVLFNAASISIAIPFSYFLHRWTMQWEPVVGAPFLMIVTSSLFFISQTFPVAAVIALTEQKSLRRVWRECYVWSFPYYLVGCAAAGLFSVSNQYMGWKTLLLILPVVYMIYRSYKLYIGRLEDEKRHADQISALHLRSIEALALAIEAKDTNTHDHLKRVQVYAIEVGKELGLTDDALEALRAAALLHDIGKLAVPEHIISKPGKLSPEDFEKMKIHPLVGAEILERVDFPYPVAPIVRAHHEKWNGEGYPYGLKGEQIPLSARILAAVDCLDALASDRQYRRALPLDEAMTKVVSESGKSFDPIVVDVLQRRYKDLERLANAERNVPVRLSTNVKIEHGQAPSAGFDLAPAEESRFEVPTTEPAQSIHFLSSIAAARQEAQQLFELAQDLGNSLSLDETLSVLAVRLKRMVPYDTMAIYVRRDDKLIPEYVTGENVRAFTSLEIPMGRGLAGWVAENRKPIVNGNPAVEPGYPGDASRITALNSALAVPLEGVSGVVGVLALYQTPPDAFSRDHLRILLAISSKISLSIENALKYRQAETSATTDYLTGLPNARSLFLHLDSELARCKRQNVPLTVLVCDLDGFKQVNDQHGHIEGNRVLRGVAQALRECCREYDYVARMGGDEFVLVLPGLRMEAVDQKAIQLAEVVRAAGREVCGLDIVTVSLGQAHFPTDGPDAEQLLAEADRRMYKAKTRQRKAVPADQSAWLADLRTTTTTVQ